MKTKKESAKYLAAKALFAVSGVICVPLVINMSTKLIDKHFQVVPSNIVIDVDNEDFGPKIIPTKNNKNDGENTNG